MAIRENSKTWQRIINAVTTDYAYIMQKNPEVGSTPKEILTNTINLLDNYTGREDILEDMLNRFNTNNPWEATAQAQLLPPTPKTEQKIKELKEQGIVKSDSGFTLTNQMYLVTDQTDKILTYGWQAAAKIFQTFGNPTQKTIATENYTDYEKRKDSQAQKNLANINTSIEDVIKDQELLNQITSPVRKRILTAGIKVNDLEKELRKYLRGVGQLAAENPELLGGAPKITKYKVLSNTSGSFMNSFKKEYSELPDKIKLSYDILSNPEQEANLKNKERQLHFTILHTYRLSQKSINTQIGVGHYLEDIRFLNALPKEHEFFKKKGKVKPNILTTEDIFAQEEISLYDIVRTKNSYDFSAARDYFAQEFEKNGIKEEYEKTLSELKGLFIDEETGNWKEYSTSVPMSRLKNAEESAALSREDYKVIRDVLRQKTMTGEGEKFHYSFTIQGFQNTMKKVIVAGRKLNNKNYIIEEENIQKTWKNREEASEFVKRWKDEEKMLRKNNYAIAEDFKENYRIELLDFIDRANDLARFSHLWNLAGDWKGEKEQINLEARAGLYNPEKFENRNAFIKLMRDEFIPYTTELKEEMRTYRELGRKAALVGVKTEANHYLTQGEHYVKKEIIDVVARNEQLEKEISDPYAALESITEKTLKENENIMQNMPEHFSKKELYENHHVILTNYEENESRKLHKVMPGVSFSPRSKKIEGALNKVQLATLAEKIREYNTQTASTVGINFK